MTYNIDTIIEKMSEAYKKGYRYFGVRSGKAKKEGQYCALSYNWAEDYEHDNSKLNGTCATFIDFYLDCCGVGEECKENIIKAINYNTETYKDDMVYIVAGDCKEYGDDPGETIINTNTWNRRRGAKVIAIIY